MTKSKSATKQSTPAKCRLLRRAHALAIASLLAMTYISCASQKEVYMFSSFHEPATAGLRMLYSADGYKWKDLDTVLIRPDVGSKVMRDPSIVRGPDGTFHLVWTSGWNTDKGFGYASSMDLVHWSQQQFIPVMEHESETVNVWAPELFYDDVGKQFIIIWASTIPFRFPKGQEEERNNHRMYYTVTKDFKTFSPPGNSTARPLFRLKAKRSMAWICFSSNRRKSPRLFSSQARKVL